MKPALPRTVLGFVIGFLVIVQLSYPGRPARAGVYTGLTVTPNIVSFTVTNSGSDPEYYEADHPITVTSFQQYLPAGFWALGIRAAGTHLVDAFNPANRIPIAQLRWSRDGIHFYRLSEQWTPVATYWDQKNRQRSETITYRIYPAGAPLAAGSFTVQIDFDARIQDFPWRP
jgi:hypothetical protein